MVVDMLKHLQSTARIRPLDLAFGEFIAAQENQQQECVALLAAYVSRQLGEQDSCIDISDLAQPFVDVFTFPDSEALRQILIQARSVAVINDTTETLNRPLVLQGNRLYLQRYWDYEQKLAIKIREMSNAYIDVDVPLAKRLISQLFPHDTSTAQDSAIDYQLIAVCLAASRRFSLITGGPGTGKTTTVSRVMALLQGLAQAKGQTLNIHLVAPTGKAAARLTQSISQAKGQLPANLQNNLPEQCTTIHRLLGALPFSPYFKFNSHNPLHLDVLVVDEASMVDLPLMSKLFAALPEHGQIILLGDKDQLASVEAGSVLSDICAAAQADAEQPAYSDKMLQQLEALSGRSLPQKKTPTSPVSDSLVVLQKSHRFSAQSGIGVLARAINRGHYKEALTLLEDESRQDIHYFAPDDPQQLVLQLMPVYRQYFNAISSGDVQGAFNCLAQQQVLCAHKGGDWGVERLNALIEKELHKQGMIDMAWDYYPGRPIMLKQNDHSLKLFNGDIGLLMADPEQSGLLKVWFISPEGQIRSVLPNRLPPHDTLYAMTIHKSQGSEFDTVYLCLPDKITGVKGLNRELVYTGLTRAKRQFNLYADKQILQSCLQQRCKRGSGLKNRLS
jgi:exodeoxyribonuclease V alpha subunit